MLAPRIEPSQAHIDNVVRVVLAADDNERLAGSVWYAEYAAQVIDFGTLHGLTGSQSLALFAVLSQRSPLVRNWSNYRLVVEDRSIDRTICVFGAMRAKCLAILASAENPGQFCTGLKINSFYTNLSGDYSAVTVDRHALSTVYGTMRDKVAGEREYRYCADVFRVAAAILGISPAQCQAIAWIVWRRMKGIVDKDLAA